VRVDDEKGVQVCTENRLECNLVFKKSGLIAEISLLQEKTTQAM
jgi:hypothetical protein